jgi:hypothetical protein
MGQGYINMLYVPQGNAQYQYAQVTCPQTDRVSKPL